MKKTLKQKIKEFDKKYPVTKSNIIRNGKHVTIDISQEKLKPNFKTSGETIIKN